MVGLLAAGWYAAAHTPDPSTQAFGPGPANETAAPAALPPAPADTGTSPANLQFVDPMVPPTSRKAIKSMLYAAAVKWGVNPYLVLGLAWHESGWQPSIVSYAGAVGIMQVMPATAAVAGPNLLHRNVNLFNAADNIDVGTALL
ncbi:MAG TPA: transglycosylase SLT domain-containing protein, partial [Candidatus Dormibacteraeota bacterium]